jgi:hypothetical protein
VDNLNDVPSSTTKEEVPQITRQNKFAHVSHVCVWDCTLYTVLGALARQAEVHSNLATRVIDYQDEPCPLHMLDQQLLSDYETFSRKPRLDSLILQGRYRQKADGEAVKGGKAGKSDGHSGNGGGNGGCRCFLLSPLI